MAPLAFVQDACRHLSQCLSTLSMVLTDISSNSPTHGRTHESSTGKFDGQTGCINGASEHLILQFIDHHSLNFALVPVLSSTIQLVLLWQLFNVYTFILENPHADKQTYRTSSSQLSYIVQGSTHVLPSLSETHETTQHQISYLSYIVKGFRHRTTIPFDHIALQPFQICAW